MQVIGMHIGNSFTEVCFMQKDAKGNYQPIRPSTFLYLPRQTLKNTLPKLLAEVSDFKPQAAFISSQFLERLFDYRLGGSTAQVVTAGCENWPFLGASAVQRGWMQPVKAQPIAAREWSFPINERIGVDGSLLQEVNLQELTEVAEKLKAAEIKRVCVHFLNAPSNPINQDRAAHFFREQGFDVYLPSASSLNESTRWRRSTLEASFTGTFDEIRSEIEKGLESVLSPQALWIRDENGFRSLDQSNRVGSIFGLDEILADSFPGTTNILDLGLESWRLIHRKPQDTWMSPWGHIEAQGVSRYDLRCQPTSILERNDSGDVVIRPRKEGFEPGPLSFGRGQKFLVFDLFSEDLQTRPGLKEQMPESGKTKRDSFVSTLCRNSRTNDPVRLLRQLRADVIDSIAWDLNLQADEGDLVVHGFFADLLGPELKKRLPGREVHIHSEGSALLTARAGKNTLS